MGLVFILVNLIAVASGRVVTSSSSSNDNSSTSALSDTPLPIPTEYSLPNEDKDASWRTEEINMTRQGLLYGEPIVGETSFYPNGSIGEQISQRDAILWGQDLAPVVEYAQKEASAALADIESNGGLKTLEDYQILYDGHWSESVPGGVARGQFSNYTSDLLFAMERLSTNPYIIKRLHPRKDRLPFSVDAQTVQNLTGTTLESLFKEGRLFIADHSYQAEYVVQEGRYAAACQGLFYIDKRSDKFLPLAIKTNVGANLTYTPLDEPNDWLLAKIMFNVNDLFHGQIYHLTNSHMVAEIVYLAALRTLSSRHPVLGFLQRLMYQAYAIRPNAEKVLFNPGGYFDQSFAFSNVYVRKFATDFYPTVTGPFEPNYFEENIRSRGLLHASYGPKLPHFPFYEDGREILWHIRTFVNRFVDATYASEEVLAEDTELQAWIAEANGPAKVIKFPAAPLTSRKQLVEILTHMAWLTGVSHHVLNQGEPFMTSGVLPLHPASLYSPIPTKKGGIESLLPWLPDEQKSVEHISLLARFSRPQVVEKNETLLHMFNSETFLSGTKKGVASANGHFMKAMERISMKIRTREFDSDGLSQGMPFVWTGMDPGVIPFYLAL